MRRRNQRELIHLTRTTRPPAALDGIVLKRVGALGPHVPHIFVAALETLVSVGSKTDLQEKGEIYRASKGSPYK